MSTGRRVVALLLALCFLSTSTVEGAKPVPRPAEKSPGVQEMLNVSVPEAFGSVRDRFAGTSGRMVIAVQDSHVNYEAQMNFAHLMEFLGKTKLGPAIKFIGLEGAQGPVDVGAFRIFPDKKIVQGICDFLVKEGLMTGSEYLGATAASPPALWGVENLDLYLQNYEFFVQTYQTSANAKKSVQEMRKLLDAFRQDIYPPALRELSVKHDAYEAGSLPLTDFAVFLASAGKAAGIQPEQYGDFARIVRSIAVEKQIAMNKVDSERNALILGLQKAMGKEGLAELVAQSLHFRTGKITSAAFYAYLKGAAAKARINLKSYPNLSVYMELTELYGAIDIRRALVQIDQIIQDIKAALITTPDERLLNGLYGRLSILDKMLNLRMTREDLAYFQRNKSEITGEKIVAGLRELLGRHPKPVAVEPAWAQASTPLGAMEGFYGAAVRRDTVMLDNLLARMDAEKAQVAVVFTGGFHTEGITRQLKAKNISYMVLTPRITKSGDDSLYLSIMLNEANTMERLFTEFGRLSPPILGAIRKIVDEKIGVNTEKTRELRKELFLLLYGISNDVMRTGGIATREGPTKMLVGGYNVANPMFTIAVEGKPPIKVAFVDKVEAPTRLAKAETAAAAPVVAAAAATKVETKLLAIKDRSADRGGVTGELGFGPLLTLNETEREEVVAKLNALAATLDGLIQSNAEGLSREIGALNLNMSDLVFLKGAITGILAGEFPSFNEIKFDLKFHASSEALPNTVFVPGKNAVEIHASRDQAAGDLARGVLEAILLIRLQASETHKTAAAEFEEAKKFLGSGARVRRQAAQEKLDRLARGQRTRAELAQALIEGGAAPFAKYLALLRETEWASRDAAEEMERTDPREIAGQNLVLSEARNAVRTAKERLKNASQPRLRDQAAKDLERDESILRQVQAASVQERWLDAVRNVNEAERLLAEKLKAAGQLPADAAGVKFTRYAEGGIKVVYSVNPQGGPAKVLFVPQEGMTEQFNEERDNLRQLKGILEEDSGLLEAVGPRLRTVVDTREAQDASYYVTSFLEGETLQSRAERLSPTGKLSGLPRDAQYRISKQLFEAYLRLIRDADGRFIVRDIHPGNAMDVDGELAFFDFSFVQIPQTPLSFRGAPDEQAASLMELMRMFLDAGKVASSDFTEPGMGAAADSQFYKLFRTDPSGIVYVQEPAMRAFLEALSDTFGRETVAKLAALFEEAKFRPESSLGMLGANVAASAELAPATADIVQQRRNALENFQAMAGPEYAGKPLEVFLAEDAASILQRLSNAAGRRERPMYWSGDALQRNLRDRGQDAITVDRVTEFFAGLRRLKTLDPRGDSKEALKAIGKQAVQWYLPAAPSLVESILAGDVEAASAAGLGGEAVDILRETGGTNYLLKDVDRNLNNLETMEKEPAKAA